MAESSANGMDGAGPDGYEVFRRWPGTGQLFDALWALANTIDAARLSAPTPTRRASGG